MIWGPPRMAPAGVPSINAPVAAHRGVVAKKHRSLMWVRATHGSLPAARFVSDGVGSGAQPIVITIGSNSNSPDQIMVAGPSAATRWFRRARPEASGHG